MPTAQLEGRTAAVKHFLANVLEGVLGGQQRDGVVGVRDAEYRHRAHALLERIGEGTVADARGPEGVHGLDVVALAPQVKGCDHGQGTAQAVPGYRDGGAFSASDLLQLCLDLGREGGIVLPETCPDAARRPREGAAWEVHERHALQVLDPALHRVGTPEGQDALPIAFGDEAVRAQVRVVRRPHICHPGHMPAGAAIPRPRDAWADRRLCQVGVHQPGAAGVRCRPRRGELRGHPRGSVAGALLRSHGPGRCRTRAGQRSERARREELQARHHSTGGLSGEGVGQEGGAGAGG
eukprot:CAMPEP_0198547288 /NCGR_PEP_ID=MMETSP1462-20131121/67472_1 /TAXON_ID=1333877 /ORGANISM="Brandtodinium nutriculum, Strain RCC3387" /LENGTH=293 /DNA_ID=CAMNT_0044277767 /DNA_START=420 /DNA_END=1297 /DNA_ORIENTATION=+